MGIEELEGKTIVSINGKAQFTDTSLIGCEAINFLCASGELYRMYHRQECCESVELEDVCGDLNDIIGRTVLDASESSNSEDPARLARESYTWTYYSISTIKGTVTLRWLGTSNGYYSEAVDFKEVKQCDPELE